MNMKLFYCVSFLVEVVGVVIVLFGGYATVKVLQDPSEVKQFSLLAIILIVLGFSFITSSAIRDLKKRSLSIACEATIITISCVTFLLSHIFRKQCEEFLSKDLAILWKVRDSASFYNEIVILISNGLDCCRARDCVEVS